MIRLGIVDFDSSHSVEFTKRLNHKAVPEEQWVEGAQIVLGCALPSAITEQSLIDKYAKVFSEELGVPLVAKPEEMIGKVDGVLIEAVDGSVHLESARPFLEAGIPVYVDKPFTCSVREARELIGLAEKKGLPVFSSSSLRYAPEVTEFQGKESETGKVLGCDAYSPASTHERNPGLYHYGIHGVETLFAVMGPGCETVWSVSEPGVDVVVGRWKDGRVGTMRGTRAGSHAYGFTAFCEKKVVPVTVGTQFIYRELLKRIVQMFRTKQPPLDPRVTLEIVGFIEAALHSAGDNGAPKPVGV
jgi:predicted dehydrogenase